jgi:hypothetical protein
MPSAAPTPAKLRKLLRAAPPAKLVGRGRFRGFCRLHHGKRHGRKMRGLTRMLEERVYSEAPLPSITRRAVQKRRDHARSWKGKNAGRKRGIAVDAQISSIANGHTRLALAAMRAHGVDLVCGQLPVVCDRSNVASAIDVVGVRDGTELVLVEIKTGYDAGRLAPAMAMGRPQKMRTPLARALDCATFRHTAQLAATAAMFTSDAQTMKKLEVAGITSVTGTLLYVTDEDVEVINLVEWWSQRGPKILSALA